MKTGYSKNQDSKLTSKEIECLKWITQGLTAKEIARKMNNISYRTVETHIGHLRKKLGGLSKLKIASMHFHSAQQA